MHAVGNENFLIGVSRSRHHLINLDYRILFCNHARDETSSKYSVLFPNRAHVGLDLLQREGLELSQQINGNRRDGPDELEGCGVAELRLQPCKKIRVDESG